LVFFSGFGNEALIAICALMMAGAGLVRTGALAPVGRVVGRVWSVSPRLAWLLVLLITGTSSAFMNNTPQVVLMIPLLTAVAARSGMSSSKLLMPMTFASQIGGMATPIGTSLNLLVIGTAASLGVPRFHMFDFALPAAIAGGVAVVYLWLIAPRILPELRVNHADESLRVFQAQLHIGKESAAVGQTLAELRKKTGLDLKVQSILRESGAVLAPLPDVTIGEGDKLVVLDTSARLVEASRALGAKLYAGDTIVDAEHPLTAADQQTAELVVTQHSTLRDRTLAQAAFDLRYQLVPLAIHRSDQSRERGEAENLREVKLSLGDVLLVQGPAEQIEAVKRSGDLLVLDATTDVPNTRKAPIAVAIMIGIVVVASLGWAPIAIAAMLGVLLMITSGCLRWRDATRVLDTSMIFLTVASLALSKALIVTGGAEFIARQLVNASFGQEPVFVLSGLMLLMAALANVISNSAAAVIGTPIAISLANLLGVNPAPFVLAVLFGVNMGYATPMADNCNLLVYSAGGYRFKDFVRCGAPLLILMWLTLSVLLPRFFPL
jgi:di/tricarboxylate transporter